MRIYRTSLGFILLALTSCSGCPGLSTPPDNTASVVVQTVSETQSSPLVTVYGVVHPSNTIEITFPSLVKIDQVTVHAGDTVALGAPLFKLSADGLNTQLAQLRAQKKEQEAILEKTRYILTNRDKLLQEGKIDQTQYAGLDTETKATEATVERIQTDISTLEQNLNNLSVTSPIAGQVIESRAAPGIQYAAKEIVMKIATMDPVTVVFPVSVDDAPGIAIGTPVTIKLTNVATEPFNSTIRYIGPTVNPDSKTFEVWASLPNPQGLLKANMRATVQYTSSVTHRVFIVPVSALSMREHDAVLFLVKGGVARHTTVTIREIKGTNAIVGSGVQPGDLVIVQGWERLQDGSPVDLRH